MTKQKKFDFKPSYDETGPKDQERAFHFYGSSVLNWFTSTDVNQVFKFFEKQGYYFQVWFIPAHKNTAYEINQTSPQIEGAHWLGEYIPQKDTA